MKRELRYVVFKEKDLRACLSISELCVLNGISQRVDKYRKEAGKPPLQCVVVEADWPEYEPVWKMIERRVDGKDFGGKSLEQCIEKAAETLPLQWIIRLCVENGAAWVNAENPDGEMIAIDQVDLDLPELIMQAIKLALNEEHQAAAFEAQCNPELEGEKP